MAILLLTDYSFNILINSVNLIFKETTPVRQKNIGKARRAAPKKNRENIAQAEGCFILINRVNYLSVLSAFLFSGRIRLRFRPSFDFRGFSLKPGLNGERLPKRGRRRRSGRPRPDRRADGLEKMIETFHNRDTRKTGRPIISCLDN